MTVFDRAGEEWKDRRGREGTTGLKSIKMHDQLWVWKQQSKGKERRENEGREGRRR